MNENLQIDPSQLDEEWLQQPLLFDQAQQEAADCQDVVNELKAKKDQYKSDLEKLKSDRALFVRADFKKQGFEKPPAQAIVDDWVSKQYEVQAQIEDIHRIQQEINDAESNLFRANNHVKSLLVKKDALENLCKLYGLNYFAVPNPGHMIDGGKRVLEAKEKIIEEASTKATEGLNKNKSKRGKTKEEVLDKIKNPDTKAEAKKRIEAEEQKTENEEGETEVPVEKPRARRRRRI